MTTHELETGQTVLLEVVPRTAYDIEYSAGKRYGYTYSQLYYTLGGFRHHMDFDSFVEEGTVVGTIQHPGVFSFDPTPFVEPSKYYMGRWKNYVAQGKLSARSNQCSTVNDSFLTLLLSIGRYWVNPLGEKPGPHDQNFWSSNGTVFYAETCAKAMDLWQEAESRKLSVEQMIVFIELNKS